MLAVCVHCFSNSLGPKEHDSVVLEQVSIQTSSPHLPYIFQCFSHGLITWFNIFFAHPWPCLFFVAPNPRDFPAFSACLLPAAELLEAKNLPGVKFGHAPSIADWLRLGRVGWEKN